MHECRICGNQYKPFISFGPQPIANGFEDPGRSPSSYRFELQVGFCDSCLMVQLIDQPEPEQMFHGEYAFFSSTSRLMDEHFRQFHEYIDKNHLVRPNPFVVEMGSNDGIMLKYFAEKGVRHLGIEPSANVARVATDRGINTLVAFFNVETARQIVAEHGQVDVFYSANVMCHIPYMHSIASGIVELLRPEGVLIFEDPYLGDILRLNSYDQIYDEHVFLFSVGSVRNLFGKYDLELIDVLPQDTHGGSMRYVLGRTGAHSVSARVGVQVRLEEEMGLYVPDTYVRFCDRVEQSRRELVALLRDIRSQGKRVVGYGATSKSTTVLNYCGIGPDLVEFICDTTPIKQGKLTPGTGIPVRPYEEFSRRFPEYALLFAWNHSKEIMAKEGNFARAGGQWILYVPDVHLKS